MNTEETKLIATKDKLQRIEAGYNADRQKYQDEIKVRRDRGEVGQEIDNLEKWVAEWSQNSEKHIHDLQNEIAELEAEIAGPEYQAQKRAQAALANMKETARGAWLQNGGNEQTFEEAWPEIERDILTRRTMEAIDNLDI